MKNFEERLTELEELNEKMKEGEVPLDEAVRMFERGIKLAKGLEKDLSKIERKIEILVNEPESPEDEPNLELFADEDVRGGGPTPQGTTPQGNEDNESDRSF